MFKLTPYLFFGGKCEEALEYYQKCFGGVVISKQYFKDAPQSVEGVNPEWIMHAEFEAFGMKLMMSDGMNAKELSGNNVAMSLVLDDTNTQAKLFDYLATSGKVMMPLADTFWGARFGKVEDQFGIRWMLHCELL
ncbi:VOC family protein [Vibrio makurazakiensis]|uniref:VOC family protein n=1 Tax=Vibrio makurazakiensis TaxID=2910250 RepID=UPI003D0C826E